MKKEAVILILAVGLLFVVNYGFLDKALENFLIESDIAFVERVIDGDTIEIENKTSVRLLGINTPEKGEKYYEEAKEFLEQRILNQTIKLEFGEERYDKYDRLLAYIIYNNTNINIEIVEKGYGNFYFYSGTDKYSKSLIDAWEACIANNRNICKKSESKCANCISINSENIINICGFSCNITKWEVKGEGREKFIFPEQMLEQGEEAGFEIETENSGGSLFLRDEKEDLVLWGS